MLLSGKVHKTQYHRISDQTDIGIRGFLDTDFIDTMADSGRRSSPRLQEKAKKEAEDEENERLAKEDELEAQGLPTDGSLEFRFINKMSASKAFKIKYKDIYEKNAKVCSWAIEAYWNVANFYPGQILKFTHAFPQCDPGAKFNLGFGTYAATTAGPVGKIQSFDLMRQFLKY